MRKYFNPSIQFTFPCGFCRIAFILVDLSIAKKVQVSGSSEALRTMQMYCRDDQQVK